MVRDDAWLLERGWQVLIKDKYSMVCYSKPSENACPPWYRILGTAPSNKCIISLCSPPICLILLFSVP
jgi:hypothetical protein